MATLYRSGPLFAKGKTIPGFSKSEESESQYVPGATWVFEDETDARPKMTEDNFADQFSEVSHSRDAFLAFENTNTSLFMLYCIGFGR